LSQAQAQRMDVAAWMCKGKPQHWQPEHEQRQASSTYELALCTIGTHW
jgi:hypothetical protein